MRNRTFRPIVDRIREENHYLGPHSDAHLLYASWDSPPRLLVSRETFEKDPRTNVDEIDRLGIPRVRARYFLPPYEHYTEKIARWTSDAGHVLVNISILLQTKRSNASLEYGTSNNMRTR